MQRSDAEGRGVVNQVMCFLDPQDWFVAEEAFGIMGQRRPGMWYVDLTPGGLEGQSTKRESDTEADWIMGFQRERGLLGDRSKAISVLFQVSDQVLPAF